MVVDTESLQHTESRRQRALTGLGILDSGPEARFDRVTRLAQQLFGVPMVSVTLIDGNRQWRKSHIGLTSEAPREGAFCDATVQQDAALIVSDASADERFRDNPFVVGDPHLRFYAGEPLHAPGGEAVGTLCVLDTVPRELTPQQARVLRDLADWVQAELERDDELDRAAIAQKGLLPRRKPRAPGYDVAAACEPSRGVSGDFYDWYDVDDDFCVSVADVMGKGMAAAIVAASVRTALRSAMDLADLEASVDAASRVVEEDLDQLATFVTLFHARVHPDGAVDYVDAGHGLALIVRASGRFERLPATSLPLGVPSFGPREPGRVQLGPKDALLCVSDGILDALGGDSALSRLEAIVRGSATSAGAVSRIVGAARSGVPIDDLTAVVVRRSDR
ncbi:SpoIIE family protein phosphatase [Leifsonia sp. fls2-241-R2A-40a]|uniref:PP2C family protein-serine/threonine phosphatase n=1 Tax=Leifsonia sp. fls2-241-R2A-40a TaxID=3040290 RepID=UPI00254BF485|nr:SpoIIE family protein phosphatase [Leifsonia sp. fls2-241-R2A-40a]